MPLLKICNEDKAKYGLWEINETEEYFIDRLSFDDKEWGCIQKMRIARRLEWLSSRWLLYLVLGESRRDPIFKDDCGKPFISSQKGFISISHSHGKSAAVCAEVPVGIDIQKRVEKIYRIASKFLSDEELAQIPQQHQIEYLHIYWGAKESIYKAYGRRRLDFKKNIRVFPFSVKEGRATGTLERDNIRWAFEVRFQFIADFILVYAVRSDE